MSQLLLSLHLLFLGNIPKINLLFATVYMGERLSDFNVMMKSGVDLTGRSERREIIAGR